MPLVETLTLLASLGGALQAMRPARPADDKAGSKDETATSLLLSYEYVKSSQEWATRANDVANGRLVALFMASGIATAVVTAIGAGFVDEVSASSPLLMAVFVLLGVIALATAVAVGFFSPGVMLVDDAIAREATLPEWDFLRGMLGHAARLETANRTMIAAKATAFALCCLCFAAQVILLGVWALES